MTKHEKMSVFEQLKSGLEDSVAYSKGELSLKTTELPFPPSAVSANDVRGLRQSLFMSKSVYEKYSHALANRRVIRLIMAR